MTLQAGLGGAGSVGGHPQAANTILDAELGGRRGGLGVWYQTKDTAEGGVGVKKEETDFVASTEISPPIVPSPSGSLRPQVRDIKMAMPTAVLKDKMEEEKSLKIRHALLRKHGKVKMVTTHRDAHVYFFPYWVKELMRRNETFENLSEDVISWWAKATWQDGLANKLQLGDVLNRKKKKVDSELDQREALNEIDLASLSSTGVGRTRPKIDSSTSTTEGTPQFASRVKMPMSPNSEESSQPQPLDLSTIPPILGYFHQAHPPAQLIRRVDTVPLLLSVSLALAKLPSTTDPSSTSGTTSSAVSPFSHRDKIHPTTTLPPQLTLPQTTSLVDSNVTLFSKSTIKDCVIGSNCSLGGEKAGVRLNRCLLMDGVVVEAGTKMDGCVLGRRCKVGANCELRDCYVQEGFVVADGTKAKGETLAAGVDESGFGDDDDMYDDEEEEDPEMEEDGEEDD